MKSLRNITKNIEQIMKTHKWSKDLEGSLDRENIEQNALIKEWELKIQCHDILPKNQSRDLWNSRRISGIKSKLLHALSKWGIKYFKYII